MKIEFKENLKTLIFSTKDPEGEYRKFQKGEILNIIRIGLPDKNGIRLVVIDKKDMLYLSESDEYKIHE